MLIKESNEENRYRVNWSEHDYQGKGTFTWPDGCHYEGEFYRGHLQGHGIFTWPDGSSYKGEWQNDLPNGRGVFTWPDGSQYDGEWEAGKAKADENRMDASPVRRLRKCIGVAHAFVSRVSGSIALQNAGVQPLSVHLRVQPGASAGLPCEHDTRSAMGPRRKQSEGAS